MSRSWLWEGGGWEYGPLRRNQDANTLQAKPFIGGPNWEVDGFGGFAPQKTTKRSGYFAHRMIVGGFSSGTDARSGHVFTRTKDWIFWVVPAAILGFDTTPTVSQIYALARCNDQKTVAANKFLGVGVNIVSVGPPVVVYFTIIRFNTDGSFDAILGGETTTLAVGTTVKYLVLGLDTAGGADNCRLWMDGGLGGAYVTSGTVETTGHVLPDSTFVTGKDVDAGMQVVPDDWCSAEGDAESDRPGVNMRQILYQARKNVTGESEWAGDHRDVDDENDASVGDADTDTNYITPSGADEKAIFGFPDLVDEPSQTATVEAVLLCWSQVPGAIQGAGSAPGYLGHYPMARTTSASLTDLSGDYGSGLDPVYHLWFSRLMRTTPEGLPWTPALFNQLQAGLKSRDTNVCGELYAIPIGDYIARPAATPIGASEAWEDPPSGPPAGVRRRGVRAL